MNTTPDKAYYGQSLTNRFAKGDKNAFGKLYDQYAPTLFGIILKWTSEQKLAENILSDCFMSAWQNRASYKPETSFLNWLLAISRPVLTLHIGGNMPAMTDEHIDASSRANNSEMGNRQQLNKSVIGLALIYGMTKQEICLALQQPEESFADSIKNIFVKQKVQL